MSKAAELAALIGSQSSLANRNMIINGNMAVHQRAATDTHNDSAVDRYTLVKNNLDTADFSTKHQIITDNPPFSDALEIKCTTADTSIASNELIRIRMRLEANTLQKLQYGSASAKNSTLCFWVKSNLTDTFSVGLTTQDGTSQNIGFTYTIAQANTWQKVVWNVPANANGTINNDNGNGMMLVWGLTVGSGFRGTANTTWADNTDARNLNGHTANLASSTDNNFYLTGVQWELGDVAQPFEHETFADNLARCQRYYFKCGLAANTFIGGAGWARDNNTFHVSCPYPVTMREAPTALETSGTPSHYEVNYKALSAAVSSGPNFDSANSFGGFVSGDVSGTPLTAGESVRLVGSSGGGTGSFLAWSAEL